MKINDPVRVTIHKNGYWNGIFKSIVKKVTDNRIGVRYRINGKETIKYYAKQNVRPL